jgi:hypothetical protein
VDRLLNEREMAALLNISVACTRKWRYNGRGPVTVKCAGVVR